MQTIAELKQTVSACQAQVGAAQAALRQAEEAYHGAIVEAQKLNRRIEHLRQFAGDSSKLEAAMKDSDPLAQVIVFNADALSMMIRSSVNIKNDAFNILKSRQSALAVVENNLQRAGVALTAAEEAANKGSLAQIVKNAIRIG